MALLVATVALMALLSPTLAKKSLSNGSVTPRSGTTATLFAFRVDSGNPKPSSVNARLTRGTTVLTIALNKPVTGSTWTRSARVSSPGTWTVSFIGSDGTSAPGGAITVTVPTPPPPSATVRPTPRPTAVPSTPRPATARPSTKATPGQSGKASATPKASGATAPATPVAVGGATQPSSPPGAGSSSGDAGRILPAILLGLLVILGVGAIALLTGRRQAEERPSPDAAGGVSDEPPAPEFVRRAAGAGAAEGAVEAARGRPRAAWEVYTSLENEPLGSVNEYLPGESTAAGPGAGEGAEEGAAEADGADEPHGGELPEAPAEG